MNYQTIRRLQREQAMDSIQELIFSGEIWKFEGSMGRQAMRMLECGACMLGTKPTRDAYGNRIPSRYEVKQGTKGSYQNSVNYWTTIKTYQQ